MRRFSFIALLAASISAQTSPFLPEKLYQQLVNEISGEIAHEHTRWFTHYHRPMGGSEGFEAVAKYVENKAREYRLEEVRYIKLKSETQSWNARHGELWLIEPERRRLAFTPEIVIALADYSRSDSGTNVELVDVGAGMNDSDYAGKEVSGKLVLAHGTMATVMEEAVWKRGARGIVYFTMNRPDRPDQIPWLRVPVENKEKTKKGTFAFVLPQREGLRMRGAMAAGEKRPFRLNYRIESSFVEPASQAIVEAVIRGSEIHDQDIVLTGHLQEGPFSANDDASGCANVLEIGRVLKSLIDRGELPRPRRDIRFWWADEISAEEQYFADQPAERRQFLANVNQDMVGAKQSLGDRVQFVTRPPWSRPHFLGDVAESVVESLVRGNTSYLAAGQARQLLRGEAGTSAVTAEDLPFSRPILSRLGTREHYDARVVPFHNNTDHQVFNMGIIGIPAITFTNWPDEFIHSSEDDLWQTDRTQLKRNAVAIAAIVWFLANATESDVPILASEVFVRGSQRLAHDRGVALRMILDGSGSYARAASLLRESEAREQRIRESIRKVARGNGPILNELRAESSGAAERQLRSFYRAVRGGEPSQVMTARERELSRKIPVLVDNVANYIEKRTKIEKPKTLHGLMAYEALNFVNGERSYAEIYRAVAAESDAAGEWYYGRVSIEDIASYLDSAEKLGVIRIKRRD